MPIPTTNSRQHLPRCVSVGLIRISSRTKALLVGMPRLSAEQVADFPGAAFGASSAKPARLGRRNLRKEHSMNTLQLHEPPSCIGTRFERTSAGIEHAERTSLHDLFRLMGFPVGDEERSPLPLPAVRRIRAGDLLIIEGAAAASIYIA